MNRTLYIIAASLALSACEMAPQEGHYKGPLPAGAPAWEPSSDSGVVSEHELVVEDDTQPSLPIEPQK